MRAWCLPILTLSGLLGCAGRQPASVSSGSAPVTAPPAQVVSDIPLPEYQIDVIQAESEDGAVARISISFSSMEAHPLLALTMSQPLVARAADDSTVSVVLDRDAMNVEHPDGSIIMDEFDGVSYLSLVAPNGNASRSIASLEGELTLRMATDPRELYVPLDTQNLHTHERGLLPASSGTFTSEEGEDVTYRWILWSESPCPEGTRLDQGTCVDLSPGEAPDGTRQYTFEVTPDRDAPKTYAGLDLVDASLQIVPGQAGPGSEGGILNFYGDPAENGFSGHSIRIRYFAGAQDVVLPIQETDLLIAFNDGSDAAAPSAPVEPRAGERMHVVYVEILDPDGSDTALDTHMPLIEENGWLMFYGEMYCAFPEDPSTIRGFDPNNGDWMALAFFFSSLEEAERFAEAHFSSVAGIGASYPSCLD